jgi:squalene/oxidosqualene cyclase-like protein
MEIANQEHRSPVSRALSHLGAVQMPDGAFEGEVVWNPMLLGQYIFVRTIVAGPGSSPFSADEKRKMIRYFEATRTPEGGWGMHPASGPYVFFTAISYVALRLLGVAADEPIARDARRFLSAEPGRVLSIPTWGKLWLSILGLYEYEGVNPVPPELFLLPAQAPFHPDRFYCHTRYIYLAIAYLYGRRFRADLGPITADLRRELHDAPYESIDFSAHRHDLAASDLHVRPGPGLRLAYDALAVYERAQIPYLRKIALDRCFTRILYEMQASRHQAISPVNGLLNCLAIFASDPHHPELAPSLAGVEAWRWDDEEEGIRYAGARSQAWDTAFAMRAVLASPAAQRPRDALHRAYGYLRATQIKEELVGGEVERRDPILGGFCFSDGQHRWPVSDCTAEALSAILDVHADPALTPAKIERIADARLLEATRFLLSRQNDDGGFGTYERRRGGPLLEALNPSEMFGSCMTERSYIECTASAVSALSRVLGASGEDSNPLVRGLFRSEIVAARDHGVRFLRGAQRPDGAFSGFWGVCFTYATFHAVEAFHAAGVSLSDPAITRAARFLLSIQKPDGGWGEHYTSCLEDRYVEHPESQATMTAWALLALLAAGESPRSLPITRAVRWLESHQLADGGWPRQAPAGVFFGAAMLDYRLYKDYFPAWALGRHAGLSARA